jgi:hypothetical protein
VMTVANDIVSANTPGNNVSVAGLEQTVVV